MNAAPFYKPDNPLRFRGIPDGLAVSHVEGSECCLIHVDNPLSAQKGVWLNPNVRVGYSGPAYDAVKTASDWLSTYEILAGLWKNRWMRLVTTTWFKVMVIKKRVTAWEAADPIHHSEPGMACLINEMQVLVWNGWAHV